MKFETGKDEVGAHWRIGCKPLIHHCILSDCKISQGHELTDTVGQLKHLGWYMELSIEWMSIFLLIELSSLFKILYLYLVWNIAKRNEKILGKQQVELGQRKWERYTNKIYWISNMCLALGYHSKLYHLFHNFCYSLHSSPLFCDFAVSPTRGGYISKLLWMPACHMARTTQILADVMWMDAYMTCTWNGHVLMHVCHCCQDHACGDHCLRMSLALWTTKIL